MAVEEWDRRQLCPDGACTGVINATGVCTVCGRAAPNWGDERKRGLRNPTDAPPIVKDEDDILPSAPAALGAMADWGTRRLCSDGGCIGVIGANNKCKVCGKPGPMKAKAKPADGDLERVAAEMAGTATASDLASIEPAESDDEYEDDEEYEDDDEGDEDEGDEEAASAAEHDHGDENDAQDNEDDASAEDDEADEDEDDDEDDEGDDEDDDDDDVDEGDDDGAISASGGRELCPDGACVGVIGANGRCKLCNKPRDWSEESA